MTAELSDSYRTVGRHLYQRRGDAFIHVCHCPPGVRGLPAMVRYYEQQEPPPAAGLHAMLDDLDDRLDPWGNYR